MSTTRTARCKVGFQGYDWRNTFAVQSPTGRTLTLHCNGKWSSMSPELLELVDRFKNATADDLAWSTGPKHECDISYALLAEIKALCD